MINVTKSFLPDREKFKSYVDKIFDSGWLTNNGENCIELEKRLKEYLGVENLLLVSNGTLALQIAYKVLGLTGEVITTPFSFVATTSSLVWEGLQPTFVDIDKDYLTIDSAKIEEAITPRTSAIVATHVYGNACEIDLIDKIAKKHKLKVIYDAAHAFGTKYKDSSILNFGDASVISFHSTKIFHTVEGGAIVFKDPEMLKKARRAINFGIVSQTEIQDLGINSKLNEFQAAMGLCVLDEIDGVISRRGERYEYYMEYLNNVENVGFPKGNSFSTNNFSHFPVLFESEEVLLRVVKKLNENDIYPRRYFYPSLETLPYLSKRQVMIVSSDVSKRILCLPLYDSLEREIQHKILEIIKENVAISGSFI
ncbi:MAG: DegT/DnrJ/EryC1/StrS family aminotransferase [Mobilitalea sp.]